MIDLFGLIKNAFVIVVTTISVLNPFNAITQNKVDSSLITPSPVLEESVDLIPENPTTSQGSSYQNSENKIIKTIPTSFPTPTIDPDPLVTCTSKTGNIKVKRSICSSYTDCPDGYGRYVFESQESCKNRWNKISGDLKNVNDQFIQAIKERSDLNSQKLKLDQDQYNLELQQKLQQQADETSKFTSDLEAKTRAENQRILEEQQEYFKNFIKTPSPTPTPPQGGGRLLDPYHTSY